LSSAAFEHLALFSAARMMISSDPAEPWIPLRWRAHVVRLSCIAGGLLVLMARRTDQLTDAQVWVEEGAQIIPSFLEHGWRAFLMSINGYLISTSRAISFLALALGGLEHYPGVSTALGLLFTAAIFVWIGTAPLIVRGGGLLPLATALVPSDVELFVVPLYTFWFAGLALFCLMLWQPDDRSRLPERIAVALIFGLSNPVVIPLAAVAVGRAAFTKARHETVVALAMVVSALSQLWVGRGVPGISATPALSDAVLVMARFLGYPLLLGFTNEPPNAWVYIAAVAHGALLLALLVPRESRARRGALLGLFLFAAVTSMVRCQPPTLMHPAFAGPRYFFFPFVFLNWLWLDALLSTRTVATSLVPVAVVSLILCSTARNFNRHHQHLAWKRAVRELALRGHASLPIQYDGSIERQWTLKLAPCGNRLCKVP
jgi:hypothetical protein